MEEIEHYCDGCGEHFDNSFEYVDHFIEEADEGEFDPVLVLPNGVRLMIGSLLRFIFEHADNPDEIRQITQSTYVTLFAAEVGSEYFDDMVEDLIVSNEMLEFDDSLKQLLEGKKPNDDESGA
jgi:hypothetical protein